MAGAANLLWLLCEYLFGIHEKHIGMQPLASSLSIIIPIVFISLGMHQKKYKQGNGEISYWGATRSGLLISAFSALIYFAGIYLYCTELNPDYLATLKTHVEADLLKNGHDAVFATQMTEGYGYPLSYSIKSFIGSLLGGFILSLVIAALYRSRNTKSL